MMEVNLDELPGNQENATILFWHVEEGDQVEEGDELVKLSVDGKPFTFVSPVTGIINEIYFDEGEQIRIGDVLSTIEEKEANDNEDEEVEEMENET
jgi:pyruvate dehydrogenase E2 component (dihydrolipoamide acetyltransferase)